MHGISSLNHLSFHPKNEENKLKKALINSILIGIATLGCEFYDPMTCISM